MPFNWENGTHLKTSVYFFFLNTTLKVDLKSAIQFHTLTAGSEENRRSQQTGLHNISHPSSFRHQTVPVCRSHTARHTVSSEWPHRQVNKVKSIMLRFCPMMQKNPRRILHGISLGMQDTSVFLGRKKYFPPDRLRIYVSIFQNTCNTMQLLYVNYINLYVTFFSSFPVRSCTFPFKVVDF